MLVGAPSVMIFEQKEKVRGDPVLGAHIVSLVPKVCSLNVKTEMVRLVVTTSPLARQGVTLWGAKEMYI